MKYLLFALVLILFSCLSPKELQVEMLSGKITKIETLYRYGSDLTRIEWTLSDRTKRFQYLKYDDADSLIKVNTVSIFLVNK